jgi:hypothetical protein
MNKLILLWLLIPSVSYSQSYAPEPGANGSTAIHMDSIVFKSWATSSQVQRGYLNIASPQDGYTDFGEPGNAIGQAQGLVGNVVSLGDSGIAILRFNPPIANGPGADFAIFENGFQDHYMELAFVEVSSNGMDYYRFPAFSEVPASPQMNNASYSDCRYVHNLAGKYRVGYGTPFDLQDLDSIPGLDLSRIISVKLIDVVGKVSGAGASFDVLGRVINDTYPTAFTSGGFDLDAIGVINEGLLSINENIQKLLMAYPNPFKNSLRIENVEEIHIVNCNGRIVYAGAEMIINTVDWSPGVYFISNGLSHQKLIKH